MILTPATLLMIVIVATQPSACHFVSLDKLRRGHETFQARARTIPPLTSALDFSGIDAFWEIHDVLASDREPTTEQWDRLFSTPGYAALEQRERRRKTLTEAFRLSYMPSKRDLFGAALNKGGWLGNILPHLQKVPTVRKELEFFRGRLESTDWLGHSLRRVQELLPPRLTEQHPPPPVSFIFFAPDGRGYPNLIVADLLRLINHPDISKFFAHELHHYYRRKVPTDQCKYAGEAELLMFVLINIEEEGIADQLDKAEIPLMSEEKLKGLFPEPGQRRFYEDYRRYYAESKEWLRRVERTFEEIALDPSTAKEKGDSLHRQLPIGGRPLGAFMARAIMREFGKKKLIRVVGDPFGFWRLYNEAALRSKGRYYALSPRATIAINKLRDGCQKEQVRNRHQTQFL